jgi:hypothetical protein
MGCQFSGVAEPLICLFNPENRRKYGIVGALKDDHFVVVISVHP